MAQRPNRRDLIIRTAAGLFVKQGYTATSIRQIADAVGCTEAAIYYHFEGGKRSLLQAVIKSKAPDFVSVLADCRQANSLSQLIFTFIQNMCLFCKKREQHIQWLISEFPKLSADERTVFLEEHLAFHAKLVEYLLPFVEDEAQANELGWILICTSFGYRQVFMTLGLNELVDFPVATFATRMSHYLAGNP